MLLELKAVACRTLTTWSPPSLKHCRMRTDKGFIWVAQVSLQVLDFEMVCVIAEFFVASGKTISRIKRVASWHLFSGVLGTAILASWSPAGGPTGSPLFSEKSSVARQRPRRYCFSLTWKTEYGSPAASGKPTRQGCNSCLSLGC